MTVHQLHYTSCEDGLEGIQGFQISALTPGAPKSLVDLAVRASAYELGPSLGARVAADAPSSFPVKFGYVPIGRSAAVFQSRYLGADFTGRMGNYFAHALLLDDVERELDGALPIDLWQSPTWVHTRQSGTTLPVVTNVAPGVVTGRDSVRQLLAQPETVGCLAELIVAAQRVLTAGRGRVVLVANDDQQSALWLATLCRSFPRQLGLSISFVTYTSRPEDSDALVSCTLPDVRLPAYGDFTLVDMTGTEPATGNTTPYGQLLARHWAGGTAGSVVGLADRITPPLAAADLDVFATLVSLSAGAGDDGLETTAETTLLDVVTFVEQRRLFDLLAAAWPRIADAVATCSGPTDLARWSDVLSRAVRSPYPPPVGLLGRYYLAAVAAPDRLWLPDLDRAAIRDIAERTVLPALLGDADATVLARQADRPELASAMLAALEDRLASTADLRRLATVVRPQAARLIHRNSRAGSRGRLLADLVLARDGAADPIDVLSRAAGSEDTEWWKLGPILWPDDITVAQAAEAVRRLHSTVLTSTGLAARIIELAVRLARQSGELAATDVEFIDDVLGSPLAAELDSNDVTTLRATQLITHFRHGGPKREAVRKVWESLELAATLPARLGGQLRRAIAEFTLRASTNQHAELLHNALDQDAGQFVAVYREVARDHLRDAAPGDIAAMIVIWYGVQDKKLRRQLTEEDLAAALSQRRSRYLDRVGAQLPSAARQLNPRGQTPKGGWGEWWKTWRAIHERRGFLARIGLRGRR